MRVFINQDIERIDVYDERYYIKNKLENIYYTSCTHVISTQKGMGEQLKQFFMDYGNQAKLIAQRAAESGSKVHDMIDRMNKGENLIWEESKYSLEEWQGALKYRKFVELVKPKIECSEHIALCDTLKYGCTIDLICMINGERWLIDHKFSKGVYDSGYIQLAANKNAWDEQYPDYKIDRVGILWLKAHTKTERKDKIQGKGWQLVEPINVHSKYTHENLFNEFSKLIETFYYYNPNPKPKTYSLPLKLNVPEEYLGKPILKTA